jgi:hypothetical protein
MKKILLAYVILTSYVNAQSLLHCLGAEESHYAKLKYTGPNYKLNQLMIEEISSLSDLKILPAAYNKICRDPKAYPSLLLLESLMNRNSRLFRDGGDQQFQYATLKTLKSNSGRLLITYLSYIQSVSTTAKCIEREIPQVTNLYSRYRYLQDVIDPKDLNGSRNELKQIFNKLKNVDRILKSCKKRSKNKRP